MVEHLAIVAPVEGQAHKYSITIPPPDEGEDKFVPYTYIIEYIHTYQDDTLVPSLTSTRQQRCTAHSHIPTAAHTRRIPPRLISEDIYKKVEILIEEGYDRGTYDHRGYDKVNKHWDDHLEYHYKSYVGHMLDKVGTDNKRKPRVDQGPGIN
ncbi:hypothetical protein Pcinc_006935 [Petrolisthes cinctipes]|uniref:Uncharacterized protein n=1 Tax=Petrolisthes cinctipes TaxID=88211 RepID=A0AAE1KXW8_PETCI|nr:hypothetical protein Pcinc_006935 [Petrolisthes cinctipes]